MDTPKRNCPLCGGDAIKRIVWTQNTAQLLARETSECAPGPDRLCSTCGARFCNDLHDQATYDGETARQKRRAAAFERGEVRFFDTKTMTADEIADAVIRELKLVREDE